MRKRNIAMILAVALLLTVMLTACNGSKTDAPAVSSGIKVEIKGSGAEKAAYEYIQDTVTAFEYGMEYDEEGLTRIAESFYGSAASTLSALRYAADCLLGDEIPEDYDRPADWDVVASMSWASPAAYFFEGIVLEAQGKADEAGDCFTKAAVNPAFGEVSKDLKEFATIKGDALRRLRDEAARVETEIFALYPPQFSPIVRHENNCNAAYLRGQATELLQKEEPDTEGALQYFHAALTVDPFSGDNYVGFIGLYIVLGDADAALSYLNEGLLVDPESEMLNALLEKIVEVSKE